MPNLLAFSLARNTITGRVDDSISTNRRVGDDSGIWTSFNAFFTNRQAPVSFFATGDIGTVPICEGCGEVVSGMMFYASKVVFAHFSVKPSSEFS